MENLSRLVVAWGNRCAEEWECIQACSANCASHLRICRFYRSARLKGATAAGEGGRGSGGKTQGFAAELAQHMEPVIVASAIAADRVATALQTAVEGGDPPAGTLVVMGNLFTALLLQARSATLGCRSAPSSRLSQLLASDARGMVLPCRQARKLHAWAGCTDR